MSSESAIRFARDDGAKRAAAPASAAATGTTDWLAFWDGSHPIYVNARHKDVHYQLIAKQIAALVPGPGARVLDYGSGEALHAGLVAAAAKELLLCEGAPKLRAALATRFDDNTAIKVVSPDEAARLPAHSLDLVVLHSVAQYLTPQQAGELFALFRRLLKPGAALVVSDIVKPQAAAATDALSLLRFAATNGFLFAAVSGLVRARLSNYWRLRTRLGLTRYDEPAMIAKLAAAGFDARRAPDNIGHNRARLTFIARAS